MHEKMVKRLTERRRQVYLLYFYKGMSYASIAGRLGVAECTVGAHLLKAHRMVRMGVDRAYRNKAGWMESDIPFLTVCMAFPLSCMQMEREKAFLSMAWGREKYRNRYWNDFSRILFLRFQGVFLCLFTKDVNRLEQNGKSFGWENIFFLRMTVGSHALVCGTSTLKPWHNLLREPLFFLFGKEKPAGPECLFVRRNALRGYAILLGLRRTQPTVFIMIT